MINEVRLLRYLVALVTIGVLVIGGVPAGIKAQEQVTIFEDDFSNDQNWTDESDGAIYRDAVDEVLVWQTGSDAARRYTIPLEAEAGAVQLRFRVNVTEAGESGGVFIGLAEALTGAMDNADTPTGVSVALNHTTTGMTIAYPWITYADQAAQMVADMDDETTYVDLGALGVWVDVELGIEAGAWTLTVMDDDGAELGQISGEMNAEHAAYNYLMVFYEGADWESLSGQLDDVVVMGGAAGAVAPTPAAPCTVSAEEPYVAVRLGPGLNRGERFSLPTDTSYTVIGWDEASDGSLWWQIAMPEAGDDRTWVQQDQVIAAGACDPDSVAAASATAIIAPAETPAGSAGEGGGDTGEEPSGETTSGDTGAETGGDTGEEPSGGDTAALPPPVQLGIQSAGECIPVDGRWSAIWLENQHLGCPVNEAHVETASFQSFLSGRVIHRHATNEIIILYSSGAFAIYLNTWTDQPIPCTVPNSWGPIAYLWCSDPNIQQWLGTTTGGLGDAIDFTVQDFQQGMILWSGQTGNVILYPDYTWAGF
jgi:hypothetical protein